MWGSERGHFLLTKTSLATNAARRSRPASRRAGGCAGQPIGGAREENQRVSAWDPVRRRLCRRLCRRFCRLCVVVCVVVRQWLSLAAGAGGLAVDEYPDADDGDRPENQPLQRIRQERTRVDLRDLHRASARRDCRPRVAGIRATAPRRAHPAGWTARRPPRGRSRRARSDPRIARAAGLQGQSREGVSDPARSRYRRAAPARPRRVAATRSRRTPGPREPSFRRRGAAGRRHATRARRLRPGAAGRRLDGRRRTGRSRWPGATRRPAGSPPRRRPIRRSGPRAGRSPRRSPRSARHARCSGRTARD